MTDRLEGIHTEEPTETESRRSLAILAAGLGAFVVTTATLLSETSIPQESFAVVYGASSAAIGSSLHKLHQNRNANH